MCKLLKVAFMDLSKHIDAGILRFDAKVKDFGFAQNENDPCIYRKDRWKDI